MSDVYLDRKSCERCGKSFNVAKMYEYYSEPSGRYYLVCETCHEKERLDEVSHE